MVRRVLCLLAAAGVLALAGCRALLPSSDVTTHDSWKSFDEARAAVDAIIPSYTQRADLAASGLDPYQNPAITILTFSDVVQRFAGAVRPEELDSGVRACLTAGKACSGYAILVRRNDRERIGSFWLDLFNFRREVDIKGWTFNALILFVDDTVVYTLQGGQPKIRDREVNVNPLGPLQGFGESLGSKVLAP